MAKKTIFQKLDSAISGDWGTSPNASDISKVYDMSSSNNKILFKTTDKDEYERKKLELQQDKYLDMNWIKANVSLSVGAYKGLNKIKLMYNEADLMDSAPEIGAALDTYSEESSLASPSDGNVVNVYSKSERIKTILEDLFVNRLNVQLTAQMVIRGMCKYGNEFMLLDIDRKQGVKGWKELPVYNVERMEYGMNTAYGYATAQLDPASTDGDYSTKFVWYDDNGVQKSYRNWQVAHFRLLTNSMYLPYGCLVGDTRIETEHGYKEMRDINVGDKVWTFNTETQERELGEVTVFMPKGVKEVYRLHTKHFEIEGTSDHKVLVASEDGFVYKEIKDLSTDDRLVCSCGGDKALVDVEVPKYALMESERGKKSTKWWSDYIDNVPDFVDRDFARFFGFMLGDGWLSHGYHVMFAIGEHPSINERYIKLLEKFAGKKASFVPNKSGGKRRLPFHTCFIGSKMLYTVLRRLGFGGDATTKRVPEWVYTCDSEIREAFLDGFSDADASCRVVSKKSMAYTIELANECLVKDLKTLAQSLGYRTNKIGHRSRIGKASFIDEKDSIVVRHDSFYFSYYKEKLTQAKSQDVTYRNGNDFVCERVTRVDFVGRKETYDFTVDNDNSNFFANGIVTHNCSVLNSARRHWRMLSLMEDMMLIYRLDRSMERRVYKIFVGGIDDADIKAYVEQIANNFKRTPIVDPMTGQVDLRKNILPVHKDTPIPLLDGRTITIEELSREYENGKENYVYSIQDNTHKVVPGKVVWCGKNYTAKRLVKITLDDGTYVMMAPEHEVILRDGSVLRADELVCGQSLMPFYRKESTVYSSKVSKYEMVYDPSIGDYEYTHRIIARESYPNRLKGENVVHHVNFNRFDNTEENIMEVSWGTKFLTDTYWNDIVCGILDGAIVTAKDLCDFVNTRIVPKLVDEDPTAYFAKKGKVGHKKILSTVKDKFGVQTFKDFLKMVKKNHKVAKIEYVEGDDVYCMTVEGLNGEGDRHNFAIKSWTNEGKTSESGIFVKNCADQDIFIPVRDPSAPTPIDTLSAGQNLTAMDDIKYIQNKVLTALRIPKSFLNFEENVGDGKNLALLDIRFTRMVNRIQQAFLMELTKIATIHLYLLGFEDELTNFTLTMNNPSTQAEQLEIETTQKKIDAIRDAVSDPGNGLQVMSLQRALKDIMKWSENEIKTNFEEIRLEKAIAAELEKTQQIIKKTGVFDKVDRIYGEPGATYADEGQQQGGMDDGMGGGGGMPSGGGGGAPDFGDDLDNAGAPEEPQDGDMVGVEGAMPMGQQGGETSAPTDLGGPPNENAGTKGDLILETPYLERFITSVSTDGKATNETVYPRADVIDKALLFNEEIDKMLETLEPIEESQ